MSRPQSRIPGLLGRPIHRLLSCPHHVAPPFYRTVIPRSRGRRSLRSSTSPSTSNQSFRIRPTLRQFVTSSPRSLGEPDLLSSANPLPSPATAAPNPRRRSYRRRAYFYSAFFLLAGTTLGTLFRLSINPPPLPLPGSSEDQILLAQIQSQGSALPIVRELASDPGWISWESYSPNTAAQPPSEYSSPDTKTSSSSSASRAVSSRLTSGPLSGSRGLAYQRTFHNPSSSEVIQVIYFGPAMAGWPGIVHGGCLATVLDETLGRCAILRFPARTGVTARLKIDYRSPTLTNGFYIIRACPMIQGGGDEAKKISDRKMWVRGTLENIKDGRVCVEAEALFVVPKGFQLRPLVEDYQRNHEAGLGKA